MRKAIPKRVKCASLYARVGVIGNVRVCWRSFAAQLAARRHHKENLGMGWKQIVRHWEAEARRQQRSQARERRVLLQEAKREARAQSRLAAIAEREEKKSAAKTEVDRFQAYLECLVSLHISASDDVDWQTCARVPPPTAPARSNREAAQAEMRRAAFRPSFFGKLTGAAVRRVEELDAALQAARARDEEQHQREMAVYEVAYDGWRTITGLAPLVLARDLNGVRAAATYLSCFAELEEFEIAVKIEDIDPTGIVANCYLKSDELVPSEELKLAANGKVTVKEMNVAKRHALFQDFVCSAAIRAGRELLALTGSDRVVVNIGQTMLDTATGHPRLSTLLAASFGREQLAALNLEKIDPSDSMKNFAHRMNFKKSTGLVAVEPMSLSENWVTT